MLYSGSAFLMLILQHAWLSISPQDDFTTLNTVHGHIHTKGVSWIGNSPWYIQIGQEEWPHCDSGFGVLEGERDTHLHFRLQLARRHTVATSLV